MSSAPPPLAWTLRPSLLTERMIGVALVLLTAAAGFGAASTSPAPSTWRRGT
jgi:hypothetical protein